MDPDPGINKSKLKIRLRKAISIMDPAGRDPTRTLKKYVKQDANHKFCHFLLSTMSIFSDFFYHKKYGGSSSRRPINYRSGTLVQGKKKRLDILTCVRPSLWWIPTRVSSPAFPPGRCLRPLHTWQTRVKNHATSQKSTHHQIPHSYFVHFIHSQNN